MKTQSEIKEHLIKYSEDYAKSKGYEFGNGAKYDFGKMLEKAANNILNPPSDYQSSSTKQIILLAEKKISVIIDNMIFARDIVYDDTFKSNLIGEATLAWAKKLCPMWPIC